MANEKDTPSSFSSSPKRSGKNSFSSVPPCKDILTSEQTIGDVSSTDVPSDVNPGERNVTNIIQAFPIFSHVKNRPSHRGVAGISQLDEGIDVSPPQVTRTSGEVRQSSSSKGQNHKKKIPLDAKTVMFCGSHPDSGFLNVKVSGSMYLVVGDMLESNITRVVTLSGAGMSTSAGIPDFRSPDSGIYAKLKQYDLPYAQAIFERRYFNENPKPLFGLLKEMLANDYKPTVAHYFIRLLEEKGILLRHITQNVDGLERLAGVSQNRVVEAHGSVYGSRCLKCKTEYDLQWLRDRLVVQGNAIPQCQDPHCLGIVKPNIVLFGESLNPRFTASVKKDVPSCDLLIIIGTSLMVEPFASTVKKVSRNCPRIIVNNIPVGEHLGIAYESSRGCNRGKKKFRDIFVQGSCDEGVMHLARLFKWEKDLEALINRCEREIERNIRRNINSVQYFVSESRTEEIKPKKERNFVKNRARRVWELITSHVRRQNDRGQI